MGLHITTTRTVAPLLARSSIRQILGHLWFTRANRIRPGKDINLKSVPYVSGYPTSSRISILSHYAEPLNLNLTVINGGSEYSLYQAENMVRGLICEELIGGL